MLRINKKQNNGFTLIETFVAITILMIAILGPLSMFPRSFTDLDFVKNQITATQLAQEGIELVIAKKNINFWNGEEDFLIGMESCLTPDGCYFEPYGNNPEGGNLKNGEWTNCDALDGCPYLYYNSDLDSPYNYDRSGAQTQFIRKISIKKIDSSQSLEPPIAEVTVTVSWQDIRLTGSGSQVEASTYIYNVY
jgi:type II secretory pathway pseudopilin PulG